MGTPELQGPPHSTKSHRHPNQDGISPLVQVEPALLQGHLHYQLPNSKMGPKPVWRLAKKALAKVPNTHCDLAVSWQNLEEKENQEPSVILRKISGHFMDEIKQATAVNQLCVDYCGLCTKNKHLSTDLFQVKSAVTA